jgi:DNA repair protein RadC
MASNGPQVRARPEDAIESLVGIVGGIDGEVVFATCIDADGCVGDSECFAARDKTKESLPVGEIFHLARRRGAAAVLVTSTAREPIERIAESDIGYTRRLIEAGDALGIPLFDHVLVSGKKFKIMSQSTDLWNGRTT